MQALILSTGTELLLGDIVNTNAAYLAKQLANLGITVYKQEVIGDNEERLYQAVVNAFKECDIVITTGGLGPTKDDITKEVFAKYFHLELIFHKEIEDSLQQYFKDRHLSFVKGNSKQAYVPEQSFILENHNGTAPGICIEKEHKIAILLPGPPNEMIPMFEKSVYPFLKSKTNQTFVSTTIKICGIGESQAEEMTQHLIQQKNPTIALYAKVSEVHFRITASAQSKEEAIQLIAPIKQEIYSIFRHHIYGEDVDTLDSVVVDLLKERNLTISIAESCSGGLLTAALIQHAGISKHLLEGVITYANASKILRLGVNEDTLKTYGAVSKETAMEMAKGVALSLHGDIGLSTTGIAGPSSDDTNKPVGLVYIGCYFKGKRSYLELHLKGNRQKIRESTVVLALNFLRKTLQQTGN